MKNFFFFLFLVTSICSAQNEYAIANNYYNEGEYEKAAQLFKALNDKNPYNTIYLKRLVSCYLQTSQFQLVEELVKDRLTKYPQQTYLHVILGYNYQRQEQAEKAKKQYNQAIFSIEKNPNLAITIGTLFKEYHLLDYAVDAYKKAMQVNPNRDFSLQMAEIYGEKGDFDNMFTMYVNILDTQEDKFNLIQQYLGKYVTEDSQEPNNILLKKILLKKLVNNPKDVFNKLLSWLFIQQKEYGKALIQEKALYARNTDNLTNIVSLGIIAFEDKDYQSAQQCFDFILENTSYPEDKINAHLYNIQIAILKQEDGIANKFTGVFNEFGINQNTLPLQVAYADFLTFQKSEPEKAMEVLQKAMSFATSKFKEAEIKLKLGEVLVFIGKINSALIYFSQVQTQLKNHPLAQQARFKVAQTSYFNNDFDWALAQLKVLKGSTSQLIANDAAALFLTISDNQPNDSTATGLKKYAKASLLAFQNKNDAASTLLQEIITEFKGQSIEDEALFKQAELFIKQAEYQKAIANLQRVLDIDSTGFLVDDSLYKLAELYYNQLNDTEKAATYYQKIIFEHLSSIYLVDARKKYRKIRGDYTENE